MLRRVHSERLVGLFFGQRALCVGALAPLNYVGTSEHTAQRRMPWKRLVPTGKAFETVFFAGTAAADRTLVRTRRLHERVNGTLPEDAGPFAQGTYYSALDDALMLWTIAVMMDSAQTFYELLVSPLSEAEREELWQDYLRFAALWGMSVADAPPTNHEFRRYFERELASDRMHLTPEAEQVGYQTAFEIPMPRRYFALRWVHNLLLLGSLPPRVRLLYGLRFSLGRRTAFRVVVRVLRVARRFAPQRLARGWNTGFFDMVGDTERWRVEHGKPTPQMWPRRHPGPRSGNAAAEPSRDPAHG
jgi:uncharacterized protein (DUF2236 family)